MNLEQKKILKKLQNSINPAKKYAIMTWDDGGDCWEDWDSDTMYDSIDDAKRGLDKICPNWRESMWSKMIQEVREKIIVVKEYDEDNYKYISGRSASIAKWKEWENYRHNTIKKKTKK